MRRLFALFVVLAITLAPALQFWCESSCAVPAGPAIASGCHGEPAPDGPALASAHDCFAHVQAPALAVAPVSASHAVIPASVPFGIAGHAGHYTTALADPDISFCDSSPPRSHAPLRI